LALLFARNRFQELKPNWIYVHVHVYYSFLSNLTLVVQISINRKCHWAVKLYILIGYICIAVMLLQCLFYSNWNPQELISSTFYSRIFCTKFRSKPNSNHRRAAQFAFMPKKCTIWDFDFDFEMMKLTPGQQATTFGAIGFRDWRMDSSSRFAGQQDVSRMRTLHERVRRRRRVHRNSRRYRRHFPNQCHRLLRFWNRFLLHLKDFLQWQFEHKYQFHALIGFQSFAQLFKVYCLLATIWRLLQVCLTLIILKFLEIPWGSLSFWK